MSEATETKKAYEIRLKSNETIMLVLTEEGHRKLESAIHDRGKMFLQIGQRTIARTEVRDFYPIREERVESLAEHLRLTPAPPQDPMSIENGFRRLFDNLKGKGLFKGYRDYDEFKHTKYHQEEREDCTYCQVAKKEAERAKNTNNGEPAEDIAVDQIPF